MQKRNLIFFGAAFIVIVAALLIMLRGEPETSTAQGPAEGAHGGHAIVELGGDAQENIGLALALVGEQPIQQIVRTTGIVSPDQNRVVHLRPLAKAIVEKVYVQLGDWVRKGQPLLLYDNIELGELIGEYLSLLGELEEVKAGQEVSKQLLDRAAALIEVDAIAQQEYELRQAEYEQAVARVESQKAQIARVEEKLHRFGLTEPDIQGLGGSAHGTHRTASHNVLRAPFDGVITKFDVSPGELVNLERELFTIVDTSSAWVLADIYEKDIGQVQTGVECGVRVASYPDEEFRGRITYISDFLEPSSRTAKVRCVVPNSHRRLKLEMFATVKISGVRGRTTLAVPITALQQMNGGTIVFVQQDSTRFERRSVQIGKQDQQWAEVLGGVREGEKVATTGSFYLKSVLLRDLIGGEH